MKETVRYRYLMRGDVQGVGLRYRASHAAYALRLTGWVRNEFDDSVTVEIQGSEEEIGKFLEFIGNGSYVRITDIRKEKIPPVPEESGFHVR